MKLTDEEILDFVRDNLIIDKDKKMLEEEDAVNSSNRYNTGNIECIDAIEDSMSPAAFKGYLKGNCMKYLWCYDYKSKPVEDLKKVDWYLSRLIEMVEQQDSVTYNDLCEAGEIMDAAEGITIRRGG